jgi:hypothetical protein
MEHCQIRSVLGKEGRMDLHLHDEFAPPDASLKMTANTDIAFQTGEFTFIDSTGVIAGFLRCSSMTGLIYTISNSRDEAVARVTFHASVFSAKPVYFKLDILEKHSFGYSPQPKKSSSFLQIAGVPSCISDMSFLGDDGPVLGSPIWKSLNQVPSSGSGGTSHESESSFGQLEGLEDEEYQDPRSFHTRRPTYKSESCCYLHNFGSRVKVAANTNFVLVRENDGTNEESEDVKHVVLRCGKISQRNKYVMDFRSAELTTLIAFATACSTLVLKTWVA